MAQWWADRFYHSDKWRDCKNAYIAERVRIDGGLCQVCHKEQGYIVHHKILLTQSNIDNPDIALNHEHLSYECKHCHDQHEGHGLGKRTPMLLTFDDNGDPIPPTKI